MAYNKITSICLSVIVIASISVLTARVLLARPAIDNTLLATKNPSKLQKQLSKQETLKLKKNGKDIYSSQCASCHLPAGEGIIGTFPALNNIRGGRTITRKQIKVLLEGSTKNPMPAFSDLSDYDIASVLTYINSSWGNNGASVSAKEVKIHRQ